MRETTETTGGNLAGTVSPEAPERCVIVMDGSLGGGRLANGIAVIALTVGQRHPALVGRPLRDASGFDHPGLIPTGIPMLQASRDVLAKIREEALDCGCDVVDFPVQGQQTKSYPEFLKMTAEIATGNMEYLGVALVGRKKAIGKIVGDLELLD